METKTEKMDTVKKKRIAMVVLKKPDSWFASSQVLIILGIIFYFASNIGINLFNKWMFSVLEFKIPLTVTAVHQLVAAIVFLPLEARRYALRKKQRAQLGLREDKRFLGAYVPAGVTRCKFFVIVFGLALFSALNYGLVAVALMKLSQADHQLIRSTGPLFVGVTFLILERRQFTLLKTLALILTVSGVVLAVAGHSTTFTLDKEGVIICLMANVSVALQMSLTGEAKHKLKLDPLNTIAFTSFQICVLILPFIFIMGEHKLVETIVTDHLVKFIVCLITGSILVLMYLLISTYLIQQTDSLFVAIAANFKMVAIILLSELVVQNTRLNIWVYIGMAIVTLAFVGSFFHDQSLEKVKQKDRRKSPCIKWPCLDRLSDPFCPPLDSKTDNRRPLCCRRRKREEERPILGSSTI